MREINEFELLNKEIVAHGGIPYDPDDPEGINRLLLLHSQDEEVAGSQSSDDH